MPPDLTLLLAKFDLHGCLEISGLVLQGFIANIGLNVRAKITWKAMSHLPHVKATGE